MLLSSEDLYSIKWHSGEEVKPSQIKSLFSYNMQSGFQTHLDMQIDGYFFLKTFLNVHTPTLGSYLVLFGKCSGFVRFPGCELSCCEWIN